MGERVPGTWEVVEGSAGFFRWGANGEPDAWIYDEGGHTREDAIAIVTTLASAPALAAEVERLREALQEIIDGDSGGTFSGSQCCEIAQNALARQEAGNG